MEKSSTKKTVLIVDDQEIDLAILKSIISDKYKVLEARNGEEALKCLKSKKGLSVQVVITDLFMPVMDGLQLLKAVKQDEVLKEMPILVVTEKGTSEEEERLLNAGACDFFSKPFNPPVLLLRIENALIRSQMQANKELLFLSKYDFLTKIYNKQSFFHWD